MLDSDFAKLYSVEIEVLNQAVKRNSERPPKILYFNEPKKSFGSVKI